MTGAIPQTYLYQYAFNQDCSCVSLSTCSDFRTLTLSPALTEVSRKRPDESSPGVNAAAMLFQTNYLALVLRSNPYKVLLWDDSLSQSPHELWSRFEVLNVVLRRDIIAVVSEYKIYVYEFGNTFSVLLNIETCSNVRGLCGISSGHPDQWTLVCPGRIKGQVRIQLGLDDSISSTVNAHNGPVGALAVNLDGSLVASASEQGTVIKVLASQSGQLLYEFRRGTTAVQISCLQFRADSKFLLAASASLTVHIFRLGDPKEPKEQTIEDISSKIPKFIEGAKYFQSSRAVAQFRIPDTGTDLRVAGSPIVGPICCFSEKNSGNKIIVLHVNGLMYEALFDPEKETQQECVFTGASAFFQPRFDFVVGQREQRISHEETEDNWNVL